MGWHTRGLPRFLMNSIQQKTEKETYLNKDLCALRLSLRCAYDILQ